MPNIMEYPWTPEWIHLCNMNPSFRIDNWLWLWSKQTLSMLSSSGAPSGVRIWTKPNCQFLSLPNMPGQTCAFSPYANKVVQYHSAGHGKSQSYNVRRSKSKYPKGYQLISDHPQSKTWHLPFPTAQKNVNSGTAGEQRAIKTSPSVVSCCFKKKAKHDI